MPAEFDLSVVIVTWNCRSFLGPCLESVWGSIKEYTFEVIVADNASSDGAVDYLRRQWPDVRVIDTGGNHGFAVANNLAFAAARGRHVLLLNPDTVVGPGALDRLVAYLDEHPGAGVVAPRLLNSDGSDQGTARRFPSPAVAVVGRRSPLTRLFPNNRWSRRYLLGLGHANDRPFEVDWVSGACLMVRRAVIDEIGGLDEGFFMHWEDADWCFRVKQAGLSVWCVPDTEVTHHEGGSRRGWPAGQVLHFHRGAYRFYAKHFARGLRRPLRPLVRAALMTRAGLVIAAGAPRRPLHPAAPPIFSPMEVSEV